MRRFIIGISLVTLLLLGEYALLNAHFEAQIEAMKPQVDTLIIRDTLALEKLIVVEKRVKGDPILTPIHDTIRINDTLFVALPREEKVYEDSCYRAVVSGYLPSLDTLSIYSTTTRIETIKYEKTNPRFSIGVNVGYGVSTPNNQVYLSPYIGVGITYNLFSF